MSHKKIILGLLALALILGTAYYNASGDFLQGRFDKVRNQMEAASKDEIQAPVLQMEAASKDE
jgi:hypothetical protein